MDRLGSGQAHSKAHAGCWPLEGPQAPGDARRGEPTFAPVQVPPAHVPNSRTHMELRSRRVDLSGPADADSSCRQVRYESLWSLGSQIRGSNGQACPHGGCKSNYVRWRQAGRRREPSELGLALLTTGPLRLSSDFSMRRETRSAPSDRPTAGDKGVSCGTASSRDHVSVAPSSTACAPRPLLRGLRPVWRCLVACSGRPSCTPTESLMIERHQGLMDSNGQSHSLRVGKMSADTWANER